MVSFLIFYHQSDLTPFFMNSSEKSVFVFGQKNKKRQSVEAKTILETENEQENKTPESLCHG